MRVRAADKGSRKALTGPQKGGIAVEKEYYTYGSDETCDAEGIQATSSDQIADETTTSTDTTSAVSYRLERIAEEALQKVLSGTDSSAAPNATSAAALEEYTAVPSSARPHDDRTTLVRALVMSQGKNLRTLATAVCEAGMTPVTPFTDDRKPVPFSRIPGQTVRLGEHYGDALFSNAHAVLAAAEEASVQVILLDGVSSALSSVDSFLARAQNRGITVYRAIDSEHPLLGWQRCSTTRQLSEADEWVTCRHCGLTFDKKGVAKRHYTCPACGGYFRMSSDERINDLLDMGTFIEWDACLPETDPLDFPGYEEKLTTQREKTGLQEAVRTGRGAIAGISLAIGVMEAGFFMGSMGSVVGEKVARLFDRATEAGLPVVVFTASGGARMQEGLISLMQMAKVSCAVERHAQAGLPYISVVTDPTTGGVTASFATQADIILIEPRALLGFAGKRVIRDTIRQELPEGFQTAEFALEHGLVDAIIARDELRATLAHLLAVHLATQSRPVREGSTETIVNYQAVCRALTSGHNTYNHVTYGRLPLTDAQPDEEGALSSLIGMVKQVVQAHTDPVRTLRQTLEQGSYETEDGSSLAMQSTVDEAESTSSDAAASESSHQADVAEAKPAANDALSSGSGNAWQSVQLARNVHRPCSSYYINQIFDGFIELHGDRSFADDGAIIAGVGWLGNQAVTVIAQEKGADLKERIRRNFGCPQPEGYRKSLRLMRQAEKFNRPIVCLVDTQGAFCGADSEERGQGNAIADNLVAMAGLRVPVVSVLCGEGGSGGALALAVANKVGMQEHAVYSVLSPEGFASILWKDRSRAPEAAEVMRMNANQVYEMHVADEVVSEGSGPAHENPEQAADNLRAFLTRSLAALRNVSAEDLVRQRHERFAQY
ncbi:acetyl-CoA carboxylase carboxyltransferase subunit alpha [Cryptobacterium curtum]